MPIHVSYDVTRLLTRLFSVTPNGIDRVDSSLAAAMLARDACSGLIVTPLGPRLLAADAARAAVAGIAAHWGETASADDDPAYRQLVGFLTAPGRPAGAMRVRLGRRRGTPALLRWLRANVAALPQAPARCLPQGARYLNVSQFPLWMAAPYEWLEARRDVKAVFFIHDLLPLTMAERFRVGEQRRHRARLHNLARFGAGAIVTSEPVRAALAQHLTTLGRTLPILVAPPAASPVFTTPARPDARVQSHAYFVCCGTIEPRKNHLLLLHVWRTLVARQGPAAPRLVLVGARGWHYGPVVDLLTDCPALRSHVVEVAGLTTPGLRRVLDGARALLMPTFAEGFGLPVHEALAAGCPVVCSDIDAFRGIDDPLVTRLDPRDEGAWRDVIERMGASQRLHRPACTAVSAQTYERSITDFLRAL